ncbi:MAG: glycine zipper domain-containing protein [Planctomycetota bacterium]
MFRSPCPTSVRFSLAAVALGGVLLTSTGCATDRQTGTLIGAAVGATIGYVIGNESDHRDHKHVHHGHYGDHHSKKTVYRKHPPRQDPYYCD